MYNVVQQKRLALVQVVLIFLSLLAPMFMGVGEVGAAQVTSRTVSLTNVSADATTASYNFAFTLPSGTSDVERIEIEFCDNPIETFACVMPTGLDLSSATYDNTGDTGWDGSTEFGSLATAQGDNTAAAVTNQITISRTDATSETAVAKTIVFDSITNPNVSGDEWFMRLRLYDDATAGTQVFEGSVAKDIAAIDITTYVQETLNFCVGETVVAGDCTDLSDTSIFMGDTDNVLQTTGPNYGTSYFRIGTNAYAGVVVQYTGSTLKSGTTGIDPGVLTGSDWISLERNFSGFTNAEHFGLAIDSVDGNHDFTNLVIDTAYDNGAGDNEYNFCTITGYSGDNTLPCDAPVNLASAPASSIVDYETGAVEYAALVAPTTSAGVYTTTINFLACATY